jgi:hypothetical protein
MKQPARHSHLSQLICGFACLVAIAITCRPAAAATPQEVDEAIKKAKAYLYKQIKTDNCETVAKPTLDDGKGQASVAAWQYGGVTATAVYGLLSAGDNPKNEPKLKAAVEWLKNADIHGHYASGMRAQVWHLLKDEREAKLSSKKDFELLLRSLIGNGPGTGFYPYYTDLKGVPQKDWYDRSVSQISVLGMWACEQAGQEVPLLYWQVVDAAWKKAQKPSGAWNYKDDAKFNVGESGTMTAAGIATLFITQDYLLNSQFGRWSVCKGGERNEWIERGLAWMDQHAPKLLTAGGGHYYYQLYGIERIGVASGRKYFGTTDWYAVGAESLVRKQNKDGSWGTEEKTHNPRSVPDTVFSILFLVRGRAPVVMNKLEYEVAAPAAAAPVSTAAKPDDKARKPTTIPDPWNQRPRDVANFASWAGKMTEEYLNWQVVNLKVAAADLHDAPILYIAGSYPLNFNAEEIKKLRQFCEGGGMILGNADCGNANFTKSFIELGHELFPHYEMRELEKTHPIYMDQMFRSNRWKTQPRVMGLSNGVRELMLLIPEADLGKWFQLRSEKTKLEMYELMQDIFLYSVDKKGLQERGTTYIVKKNTKVSPEKTLSVARLLVGDNSDPEPGGWRRMAAILHNTAKLDVKTEEIRLGQGKLAGFHFAHLTGTTKFKFTDEGKAELKEWVQKGGTLLVDAAGGSNDFATSAEKELAALFGGGGENNELGQILPPENEIYSAHKIDKFSYRQFVRGKISGGLNVPRVRAIMVDGRPGVLYSREDLSAGMVGEEVDGVLGYTPETATSIVRNIVLSVAAKSASTATKTEDKPAPAKPPAKTTPTPKPKK